MSAKSLVKIIPVLGSIVLFLSWVFQQTMLEDANSTLESIYNARDVFQTYQSNNAVFNAIIATATDEASIERIRGLQISNYELGLREMELLLDQEDRVDIPAPPNTLGGAPVSDVTIQITQERLEKIQGRLANKRDGIIDRTSTLNRTFYALYGIGSVTVLIGSLLNVIISPETD